LLQQNPVVLNWGYQLTQVVLYNGHKTVVVVVLAVALVVVVVVVVAAVLLLDWERTSNLLIIHVFTAVFFQYTVTGHLMNDACFSS